MRSRFLLLTLLNIGLASLLFSCSTAAQTPAQGSGASVSSAAPLTEKHEPISPEVTAAEAAIAGTDWKTAEAKLDSWLAEHPNDARALFDAGYVADVQNRSDDAASLYRRAIQSNPDAFDPRLMLGVLLAREGKTKEAREQLERATQLDPGEGGPELKARAWRTLARIDRDSDPTAASNDLLQALKISPETTNDTLMAADLAAKTGDMAAAEAAYRRVLAQDPKSEAANERLAHLLIQEKQYPEAETLLRAALEHDPNDPALNAQLAVVLAEQNKAEALPLLEKLHAAHPDDTPITRMLADVMNEAGDYTGSDELYVKLLASSPKDVELLVAHGQNLVRQSKYAQAYDAFDRATQLDPKNADGWSGLAYAASHTDHPSVTLHALAMRSQLLPENSSTYFLWATAYDSLHERAQAAAYYHHFLDSAGGKFPIQEWQARQRLKLLEK